MAHANSLTIDGVDYQSVRAAARALHARGLDNPAMAAKLGVTASRVSTILVQCGLKSHRTATETAWTETKVETAVRLFPACLEEVARHLEVPYAELRDLWVKGKQPPLPPAPVEETEPAKVYFGHDFTRDEDEAELARLAAEDPDPEVLPQPVSRFPAPKAPASSVPAPRLIPPGGIYPGQHEVRLVREDGKWLHESLGGFTDKVKHAWQGDRTLFETVKARMPKLVAKLSMEVVA
jgi:hypothetical protein